MYGKLTDAQKDAILREFDRARDLGATDPGHAAVCAAHNALNLSERAWNGRTGSDAFAAAFTLAYMRGRFTPTFAR